MKPPLPRAFLLSLLALLLSACSFREPPRRTEAGVALSASHGEIDVRKARIVMVQRGDTVFARGVEITDTTRMARYWIDTGVVDVSVCEGAECSKTARFEVRGVPYDGDGYGSVQLMLMFDTIPTQAVVDSFWRGRKVYLSNIVPRLRY